MTEELVVCEPESIIPPPASPLPARVQATTPELEMSYEVARLVPSAGTLELTEAQEKILFAPIPEEDIEIRPDGLIYAPWMQYASRLRDAFHGNWSLVPKGDPKKVIEGRRESILWGFWLIVQGKMVAYAIGEQEYHADNPTMSWSDACEGAKSNALMRCCKGMGISLDLWKPSFINSWKEKYAESYFDQKKNKYLWRKRGQNDRGVKEAEVGGQGRQTTGGDFVRAGMGEKSTPTAPSPAPSNLSKFYLLAEIEKEKDRVGDAAYYALLKNSNFNHANEVPPERRTKLLELLTKMNDYWGEEDELYGETNPELEKGK